MWRQRMALGAFVFAFAGTALDLIFSISWLQCGGSPHGFDPAPGVWRSIRPALKWVYLGALLLSSFAKRKERVFLYLSVISTFAAGSLVNVMQMD